MDSELPFSGSLLPEGECGVKPISRFEKGGVTRGPVAGSSHVVADVYLPPPTARKAPSHCMRTNDLSHGEAKYDVATIHRWTWFFAGFERLKGTRRLSCGWEADWAE